MSDYIHQLYKLQPSFGQRYTQQHFLSHQYGDGFQAEIKTPCKRKCKLCKIPKQLSSNHKPSFELTREYTFTTCMTKNCIMLSIQKV